MELESSRLLSAEIYSLEPLSIIIKGAEICSYLLKELWEDYREDWKPNKDFEDRIAKDGLKYWHIYGKEKEKEKGEESATYYRKLYDIRNNFLR